MSPARPRSASPVDSVPQKSGQELYGPWLQLRLRILFRPTSSRGTRCVLKFSRSSNFLHRAGWESTRGGSLASGRPGLGLASGCASFYNNFQILNLGFFSTAIYLHRFFFYKSHILVKAVFFATAIYLHRFCFSPVKLGLGQQRKKPEATAGLVSEMVLGATTWLVSWHVLVMFFQVWRHTCILIDFLEGRTAFFENGEKLFEKKDVKVL